MDCINARGIPTLQCIPLFFNNIISAAFVLSGVTAVVLIIIAGIKYISSAGDPIRVESAKKTMTYAVIGLVLVLLSFVMLKVISTVTQVDCQILGIHC